ncbi:MAG: DUF2442 domain-containing protein [Pseudomonadota bacterium]
MFLHIKDARHIENYKVEILFNNGKQGIADLKTALKGPVFEALKNEEKFAEFVVDTELGTIVWSNGADLAPEFFYFQAFKHEPELQSQFKQWGYIT